MSTHEIELESLLNVCDTCPWKTAKLSGEVVWAADGGLGASRHGVPVTETTPGNGAQQLLPGRGSPSPAEVIPCVSMEPEPQSRVRHTNALCSGPAGLPCVLPGPQPGRVILCEVTLRCDVTVVPRTPLWQRWERWLSPLVGPAGSGTRESVASIWRYPAIMERLRALRGESLHLSAHRDAARARVCLQCLVRTCQQHCPCSAECSCPPWFPQSPSKGNAPSPVPANHTQPRAVGLEERSSQSWPDARPWLQATPAAAAPLFPSRSLCLCGLHAQAYTSQGEKQGVEPCPCLRRDFAAAAPARSGGELGTSNHQSLPSWPSATVPWVPGPGSTSTQGWVAAGKASVTDPCPQGDRAQAYCELESALWEDNSRPPCGVVNRLLAEVSQDLTAAQVRGHCQRQKEPPAHAGVLLVDGGGLALPRASGNLLCRVSPETLFQGVTSNVRTAASNVLVALARTHFTLVMAELQSHLKATGDMSKEFVLITLSKLFSTYGRVPSAS